MPESVDEVMVALAIEMLFQIGPTRIALAVAVDKRMGFKHTTKIVRRANMELSSTTKLD